MITPIAKKLIDCALPLCGEATISDVRLGLGYSAVCLDHGGTGICWSPKSSGRACTVFDQAGTLVGRPATELLLWLFHPENPWYRAIGLATLNAVLRHDQPPQAEGTDIVTRLGLSETDRVTMIGCFHPLLAGIRSYRCSLDIVELEDSGSGSLSPEEGRASLRSCTVAILTGTSLVTETLDELLAELSAAQKKARAVALLGPSVPLLPEAFRGTPVTHLAGSWVRDSARVLQVVSEGGGTPQMKPSLVSVTLLA